MIRRSLSRCGSWPIAAVFLLAAGPAAANMAPPPDWPNRELTRGGDIPTAGPDVGPRAPLVVRRDTRSQVVRVIIPRKFLPADYQSKALVRQEPASPQQKAINAGLLLSAVMVCGGVAAALFRRRKAGAAAATAVVGLLLVVAVGAVWAEPPPYPVPQPAISESLSPQRQIVVEVTDDGEAIMLVWDQRARLVGW